ncbi:hypothetical protein H340_01734 [Streptomyces mobaraensis NBRC 13819 = DSM 40847]|uniref:Uncharacterized protein n=1 Tax=Streptomyces mobaraensis (strain ATCC 29032 / DSM 40847 / JCM 4168 / NBRC 13819 / NCIMB 11159 / IPCR 16-22) TaxID=1223523 RepID=M3CEL6_STRM1|nr:hypothetical protein H340_01734 [Streptomyces mobaraensis NBRC 13819 = DSM 40847]
MAPITLVMGATLVPAPFRLGGPGRPGPGAPPVVPRVAPLPTSPGRAGRARPRRTGQVRHLHDGRQVGGQVRVL